MEIIDDEFQIIDNQEESETSSHAKSHPKYSIHITPSKNGVDLNFMENQFYQFQVKRKGQLYCVVERRFSQFELIFELLSRKQPGFIFPAFPENSLFAFIKSKVSISRDEYFIARRLKIIQRFFNIVLNSPLFEPEHCHEVKEFLSKGKEFQTRKQIEKGTKSIFNISLNTFKTYFTFTKQNKHPESQSKIFHLKALFQALYVKCQQLIDCLRQQILENRQFLSLPNSAQKLIDYVNMIKLYDEQQMANLKQLQNLQFNLFCQNQDIQMVNKIFNRINELNHSEDSYSELKAIELNLEQRINTFINEKLKGKYKNQQQLKYLIEEIKIVGRITN